MAFGALLSTASRGAASITNPFAVTAGFSVNSGDLVIVGVAERVAATAGTCTDGLAGSYSELNAGGLDSGNATGKWFYKLQTASGTCTPSVTATASSDDAVIVAARFEGPFLSSPLDKNPTPVEDVTSPFTGPSTGTLTQADELVVTFYAGALGRAMSASSPNTLAISVTSTGGEGDSNSQGGAIGYQVVAATTAVAPAWTAAGGTQADNAIFVASFMKDTGGAPPGHPTIKRFGGVDFSGGLRTPGGGKLWKPDTRLWRRAA